MFSFASSCLKVYIDAIATVLNREHSLTMSPGQEGGGGAKMMIAGDFQGITGATRVGRGTKKREMG